MEQRIKCGKANGNQHNDMNEDILVVLIYYWLWLMQYCCKVVQECKQFIPRGFRSSGNPNSGSNVGWFK